MTDITPTTNVVTVVVAKPRKSKVTAVILVLLFGTLGLFYFGFGIGALATIVAMFFTLPAITSGNLWVIPVVWAICIAYAIFAVDIVNKDR